MPGQLPIQRLAHLVKRPCEHREPAIQLPAHPHPLRTLTREHHRHPATTTGHTPAERHTRCFLTPRHNTQPSGQLSRRTAHDHRAVLQSGTSRRQRPAHIHRRQLSLALHPGEQPSRLAPQRGLATPRHHPRHDTGHDRARIRRRLHGRGLLQDDVGVRPTHTEGRHTRPARTIVSVRPLPCLVEQLHRTGRPVHLGRRLIRVQGPWQHTVLHGLHHLDDTGHTGGGLRMPDVGLQRAQPQRLALGTFLPIRGDQGLCLDRIAQRRPRTVRLDRVHIRRRYARVRQCGPDDPLLRRTVRRRQTIGRTVLVHRRAPDHRQHPVTIGPRIRQPLQQQHARTLGPSGTVGVVRERPATAVGRQPALTAELHEDGRGGHHRDATGQGQRAFAVTQRLGRQVQ